MKKLTNEQIFEKVAVKINPEFHFQQFKQYNHSLFKIIMDSINECQKPLKAEIKRQKKILDDDTEYNAMRNYAKSLERKLGIDQEKHK